MTGTFEWQCAECGNAFWHYVYEGHPEPRFCSRTCCGRFKSHDDAFARKISETVSGKPRPWRRKRNRGTEIMS